MPPNCERLDYELEIAAVILKKAKDVSEAEARDVYAKFSGMRAELGDVVTYLSPGGGGYGDPARRSEQARARDVAQGWVHVKSEKGSA